MFTSSFAEGTAPIEPDSNEAPHAWCPRKVITSEKSFELLHLVLYYLYTKMVCFCTDEDAEPLPGMPDYCHPEEVYAIAHEYELEGLQQKALNFLRDTCTIENIVDRLFGKAALVYEDVGKVYEEFVLRHWDEIKNNKKWTEYFHGFENEDSMKIKLVLDRLLKLMGRLRSAEVR